MSSQDLIPSWGELKGTVVVTSPELTRPGRGELKGTVVVSSPELTRPGAGPGRGEVKGETRRRPGDLDPKDRKCANISICRLCMDQLLSFFFFFFKSSSGCSHNYWFAL